ncbi:hypothetical protein LTR75_007002 [Friedmanniomyces endolithicus]|nr:hypothetical protein LTR75_007002 [Friedmanniomyces endolithicus]
MPSSSTHNTSFEREIQRLFRQTHLRLYHAQEHHANMTLLGHFADLLDMEPRVLFVDFMRPQRDMQRQTASEWADEASSWEAFVVEVNRVGMALDRVERVKEVEKWLGLSTDLLLYFGVGDGQGGDRTPTRGG